MNLYLNWRMAARRKLHNGLNILFVFAVTVFLLLYPKVVQQAQLELAETYDNIEVTGWLLNGRDYSDPAISFELRDRLLATGQIEKHYAYSYLYISHADSRVWQSLEKLMPGAGPEQRGQAFYDWYVESSRMHPVKLYALSEAGARQSFTSIADGIRWAEGWSAADLAGDQAICVLPSYTGFAPGDTVPIVFRSFFNNDPNDKELGSVCKLLTVAGVYENNDPTGEVGGYIPLEAGRALVPAGWLSIRSLQFTVKNNRQLPAFKQQLFDMGLGDGAIRAAIDDRILDGTVAPLESSLKLLRGLEKLFYAAVAFIGFFLCFLLARGRKGGYAVMRMLGESTARVTVKALLEQLVLCAAGVLLGALAAGQGGGSLPTCAVILACYTLGAAVAVLLTVRVNVMEILRDKE